MIFTKTETSIYSFQKISAGKGALRSSWIHHSRGWKWRWSLGPLRIDYGPLGWPRLSWFDHECCQILMLFGSILLMLISTVMVNVPQPQYVKSLQIFISLCNFPLFHSIEWLCFCNTKLVSKHVFCQENAYKTTQKLVQNTTQKVFYQLSTFIP